MIDYDVMVVSQIPCDTSRWLLIVPKLMLVRLVVLGELKDTNIPIDVHRIYMYMYAYEHTYLHTYVHTFALTDRIVLYVLDNCIWLNLACETSLMNSLFAAVRKQSW